MEPASAHEVCARGASNYDIFVFSPFGEAECLMKDFRKVAFANMSQTSGQLFMYFAGYAPAIEEGEEDSSFHEDGSVTSCIPTGFWWWDGGRVAPFELE